MGAPRGNQNSAKGRWWESAVKRALSRKGGSVQLGLAPIADKLVAAATEGNLDAIREIACRLDGKPTEHVHLDQDVTVHVGDRHSISAKLERALAARAQPTVQ